MMHEISVVICMGSSCFSRGNNRNIEAIQQYLAERGAAGRVKLAGHLCENQCRQGPNVVIDGQATAEADPVTVVGLLDRYLSSADKG